MKTKEQLVSQILSKIDFVSLEKLNWISRQLCHHDNLKTFKVKEESASCADCGLGLGWHCPDSPDHLCHYFSEESSEGPYVELKGNKKHYLPKNHDSTFENSDVCLFCHLPDERK